MSATGRPFCIGLTGGIGSGKSTVAEMFADLGAAIIDTDQISRALTQAGGAAVAAIRSEFGDDMIKSDGSLDRVRMRAYVFAQADARRRLEAILHPMIRAEAERRLMAEASAPYVLLVVPLLVETGAYRNLIDRVLVVDCDEATQLRRIVSRDGLSEADARAIMAVQVTRQQRLAAADDVLPNAGELERLRSDIGALHQKYQKMARAAAENIA
ncbi:MAG: dephospho-CoA kinase [Hydrogenophilaceae bacterium]|nr:dephospho-CoA kinase [Hydrogenophilaceae bacterium]